MTPAGVNFNTLPGTIQDIINDAGSDPYDLTACKTAVEAINEAMAKPNGIITQTVVGRIITLPITIWVRAVSR